MKHAQRSSPGLWAVGRARADGLSCFNRVLSYLCFSVEQGRGKSSEEGAASLFKYCLFIPRQRWEQFHLFPSLSVIIRGGCSIRDSITLQKRMARKQIPSRILNYDSPSTHYNLYTLIPSHSLYETGIQLSHDRKTGQFKMSNISRTQRQQVEEKKILRYRLGIT